MFRFYLALTIIIINGFIPSGKFNAIYTLISWIILTIQILWDRTDSFGDLLGFNNSKQPELYYQPNFMNVVSNYAYNEFNNNNTFQDNN